MKSLNEERLEKLLENLFQKVDKMEVSHEKIVERLNQQEKEKQAKQEEKTKIEPKPDDKKTLPCKILIYLAKKFDQKKRTGEQGKKN